MNDSAEKQSHKKIITITNSVDFYYILNNYQSNFIDIYKVHNIDLLKKNTKIFFGLRKKISVKINMSAF